MIWQAWVYIIVVVVSVLVSIANAGQDRKPYSEGGQLVVQLIIQSAFVAIVLSGMLR